MNLNTFRTEITCPSTRPINLQDRILTTGSCFADLFGQWLHSNKFQVLVNPFGTNYNPISIHQSLTDALHHQLNEQLFIEHQGVWHHFHYHSQWSSKNKEDLKASIQKIQQEVKQFLTRSNVLIITYGTAWVYEYKKQNCVVSNCHKIPGKEFDKRLLSVEEVTASFHLLSAELKHLRPDLRIIVTVSPVRHVKDTLVLNSVSKATLRLACHAMAQLHADVAYFPSYEIMMDDLRVI